MNVKKQFENLQMRQCTFQQQLCRLQLHYPHAL